MVAVAFTKPARQLYSVAGRFLLVDSEPDLFPSIDALISRLYLTPSEEHAASPQTVISARFDSSQTVPYHFERFQISGDGDCYSDGLAYFFDFATGSVLVNPPPDGRVEVTVRNRHQFLQSEPSPFLSYALSFALRRCGLFEIHSGAVIEPESDRGILFVGPSGSGKSTLTLQLAANGWRYVGDDVLLLEHEANVVKAHALRRFFEVTKETIRATGSDSLRKTTDALEKFALPKQSVAPEDFLPGRFAASVVPRAIFFPSISSASKSIVRRQSQAQTMTSLLRMCPWACYDRATTNDHLCLLADLAKQCVSFELSAGRDVLYDPAHIAQIVSEQLKS